MYKYRVKILICGMFAPLYAKIFFISNSATLKRVATPSLRTAALIYKSDFIINAQLT